MALIKIQDRICQTYRDKAFSFFVELSKAVFDALNSCFTLSIRLQKAVRKSKRDAVRRRFSSKPRSSRTKQQRKKSLTTTCVICRVQIRSGKTSDGFIKSGEHLKLGQCFYIAPSLTEFPTICDVLLLLPSWRLLSASWRLQLCPWISKTSSYGVCVLFCRTWGLLSPTPSSQKVEASQKG